MPVSTNLDNCGAALQAARRFHRRSWDVLLSSTRPVENRPHDRILPHIRLAVFSLMIGIGVLPAEVIWSVSTPEQQGFDKAKLDGVRDNLAAHSTKSFLVA